MDSWEEIDPQTIEDRAQEYASLSSFFLQLPTRELLESTKESVEGLEGQGDGLAEIADYFAEKRLANIDDLLEEVGADRTYLVRGVSTKGPRPPYGSLYAGADMSVGMAAVAASYRKAGFVLRPDIHDTPDFLGVELNFMATLLNRVADLARSGDDAQAQEIASDACKFFISLLPFARAYIAEALPYAKTGYCRGYLMMLDEFMQSEQTEFQSWQ